MSAEIISEGILPAPAADEEPKDLGFGSIVTEESRLRFVNRDGSFNARRSGLPFWPSLSPYHLLLTVPWGTFLGLVTLYFVFINASFAFAYLACGDGALVGTTTAPVHSGFWLAFFFSVHTFATIGYGNIAPVGMAANLIVVVESLAGLLTTALITGLIFARFSRPTAKIVFSSQAVMAPYKDITGFMFRITNARKNQLINLEAKVSVSLYARGNGPTNRKFYQLKLERSRVDVFPLAWTIVHPIDEESPLYEYNEEQLRQANAEFVILLTGLDDSISQTVHTRSSYRHDEIVWNAKFSNIYAPIVAHEPIAIDVSRLHDIEPLTEKSS